MATQTFSLREAADKILERKRLAKRASMPVLNRMFDHPVVGKVAEAPKSTPLYISPGAVVGGVSGVHGAVRSGGGTGSGIAGGLVGTLVGDAVYSAIAKALLTQRDSEAKKLAVPMALLASTIAGQVSGLVTKKWLLGDAKKEKHDA